jgi:hypothetical protein
MEVLAVAIRVTLLVRLADAQAAEGGLLSRCGAQPMQPVTRPAQRAVHVCGSDAYRLETG